MSESLLKKSDFTPKSINELNGMTFFVEAYQRGYKWDIQQVLDLLSDIHEFEAIGSRFYCLQPVVVKKITPTDKRISEKNITDKDKVYELIDGQQRLTTTFIILSLLDKEQLPFQIIYKTRPESELFLSAIAEIIPIDFNLEPDNIKETNRQLNEFWKQQVLNTPEIDNVDNYHFYKACLIIHQWSKSKDKPAFTEKLLQRIKVIWYNIEKELYVDNAELYHKNAENIFIDFNQGKIQLEQAELIKALFVIKFKEILTMKSEVFRLTNLPKSGTK